MSETTHIEVALTKDEYHLLGASLLNEIIRLTAVGNQTRADEVMHLAASILKQDIFQILKT